MEQGIEFLKIFLLLIGTVLFVYKTIMFTLFEHTEYNKISHTEIRKRKLVQEVPVLKIPESLPSETPLALEVGTKKDEVNIADVGVLSTIDLGQRELVKTN